MSKLLNIKELSKNYLTKKQVICALKSIDLEVEENDFIVLVGPSGCGKSTILSIIGGLENKSSGTINLYKSNLKVGYMFQEDALFPWLTVLDNCLLGLKIKGKIKKEDISYVKHLLEKYGLSNFEKSLFLKTTILSLPIYSEIIHRCSHGCICNGRICIYTYCVQHIYGSITV